MWLRRSIYERLVSEAALAVHVPKLELRAEQAEAALVRERNDRISEVRHVLSMFLRREKTYPLPATETEKVEARVEQQQRQSQLPRLTPDQEARLAAIREYAKQEGITQEEADRKFMASIGIQVDE